MAKMVVLDVVTGGWNKDGTGRVTTQIPFEGIVGGKCGSASCQCKRFGGGMEVAPKPKGPKGTAADDAEGKGKRHGGPSRTPAKMKA